MHAPAPLEAHGGDVGRHVRVHPGGSSSFAGGLLPHTAVDSGTVGILMWAGMLVPMLFGWRDYAQGRHGHGTQKKAAA